MQMGLASQSDAAPIRGSEDTAAVALVFEVDGYVTPFCSGVLIDQTAVLTAGHCVADLGDALEYVAVSFAGDLPSEDPEDRVPVSGFTLHPLYGGSVFIRHDIAIVHLTRSAPRAIVPLPVVPSSTDVSESDLGSKLHMVGYGLTESGSSGARRAFGAELQSLCDRQSPCPVRTTDVVTQFSVPLLLVDHTEGGGCDGDSGGPALMDVDGTPYVVGVLSLVQDLEDRCTHAGFGAYVRVGAYESFIRAAVDGTSHEPTLDDCTASGSCDYTCRDVGACRIGAACLWDSDCAGGTCFVHVDGRHASCRYTCAADGNCPGAGLCVGGWCRASCAEESCEAGYFCDLEATPGPTCQVDAEPTADATLGEACREASDCNSAVCRFEAERGTPPGGMCIDFCAADAECPPGSVCVLPPPTVARIGHCARSCDESLPCEREGHTCWSLPGSESTVDGHCSYRCSEDEDCAWGQSCEANGSCRTTAVAD